MKNKKTVLMLILIVAMAVSVYAQQYDSARDFEINWDKNVKDGVVITGYDGTKKEVRIPPSIQNVPVVGIGERAFMNKNITNVIIPNGVRFIYQNSFWGCSNLTSVTIPDSVTIIGDSAFFDCTSLTRVTIPNSVTSIESGAFRSCTSLTAINVDTSNPNYSSENGVLYNKAKTTLIQYPSGKTGAFTVPNSVASIGIYAFYGCTSLTSVTIPNSVTTIGPAAFMNCTSLISVTIGNSVTSIEFEAFRATSLNSVTIPSSVKSIGRCAFESCRSLTNVTIEGTITSSGFSSDAFGSNYLVSIGDLRDKYLARDGGPGTYKRFEGGKEWRKQ